VLHVNLIRCSEFNSTHKNPLYVWHDRLLLELHQWGVG